MNLEALSEYMPVLIPLALLQLGLMIAALVHVLKNKNTRYFSVPLWVVVILVVNTIGPVIYFIFGRGEKFEESADIESSVEKDETVDGEDAGGKDSGNEGEAGDEVGGEEVIGSERDEDWINDAGDIGAIEDEG